MAGVKYHTVNCMESPDAPELTPVFYEIHKALADETNRINAATPGSDGIFIDVNRFLHVGSCMSTDGD
jgi:hypothetical protein